MAQTPLTASELVIDLAAVRANWRRLGEHAGGATVAAMVKADGYGLGAVPIAHALALEGCREFFVADVGEAVELRAALPDADIFVLAGAHPGTTEELITNDLVPVLISAEQIERWSVLSTRRAGRLRCSLHLDTGMNRTGLDAADTTALLADPSGLDVFEVVHVMSHLASADDPDTEQNQRQLEAYRRIRAALPMGIASLANTPGIALGPDYHFDHVRPGIGLYGADPSPGRALKLEPVIHLRSPVLQVRTVAAGDTVGYSATHTAMGERRIATIGVGYGDGFLRSQSGRGRVAFDGHAAPIVGRVSMDLITADITELPADVVVEAGTAAELIGATITVDDVADAAGTIAYEILTSLGDRYRRQHVN
ncbi:MAG: alanine racemase [Actinomycetota bacterium]